MGTPKYGRVRAAAQRGKAGPGRILANAAHFYLANHAEWAYSVFQI
jgi:hypothetical protein